MDPLKVGGALKVVGRAQTFSATARASETTLVIPRPSLSQANP
jgi:hypothetical protein